MIEHCLITLNRLLVISAHLGLALGLSTVLAAPGFGAGHEAIEIKDAWIRAAPPGAPVNAGYITLLNKGQSADRLVVVRSAKVKNIEIHQMKMEGGTALMVPLENGWALPPGATVTLKPGGFHLMMMGMAEPAKPGLEVPLILEFEKAGVVKITAIVKHPGEGMGGNPPHGPPKGMRHDGKHKAPPGAPGMGHGRPGRGGPKGSDR